MQLLCGPLSTDSCVEKQRVRANSRDRAGCDSDAPEKRPKPVENVENELENMSRNKHKYNVKTKE